MTLKNKEEKLAKIKKGKERRLLVILRGSSSFLELFFSSRRCT